MSADGICMPEWLSAISRIKTSNPGAVRDAFDAWKRSMSIAALLGYGLAFYAVAGLMVGLAFAMAGVDRVLPGYSFSYGACLMIFPGAAVLWPYVLFRWLRSFGRT
jgi:hypothetical protein